MVRGDDVDPDTSVSKSSPWTSVPGGEGAEEELHRLLQFTMRLPLAIEPELSRRGWRRTCRWRRPPGITAPRGQGIKAVVFRKVVGAA